MADRICVKCGCTMEVVKTGFHFMSPDGGARSGDLWGCRVCGRFQLHGVPAGQFPWWPLDGAVIGQAVPDPDPESARFFAYLEPKFDFLPLFHKHMDSWYPDFEYERKVS